METSEEPRWPKSRDLARYELLAGFSIADHLKTGGLWIDIGPGETAAPMLVVAGRTGVELKAIGPHSRSFGGAVDFHHGQVPEDRGFFRENCGRAQVVTDIYGAVSYAADPVQALIYAAALLGEGGRLAVFTELHRMGELSVWDRVTLFFHERMRQQVSFQTLGVVGDADSRYSTCLRVVVDGGFARGQTIDKLFEHATHDIGVARQGGRVWALTDESVEICRVDYALPD